jgi:nuclear pore complex protein Nup160
MATPLTEIQGMPYAFMVSLDHKLRVWNLQTGRLSYAGDILSGEPESNEAAKPVIDPSYSQLVKTYPDGEDTTLCVTYSPLGTGEFKFWSVVGAIDGSFEVDDLFPMSSLVPQTPTADLWTLADFSVVLDRSAVNSFTLWVLWKNNTTYRVQKVEFRPGNAGNIKKAWSTRWEAMAAETLREANLPAILVGDHADGPDKWLNFILTPGRFTAATIETGLAIYGRGLGGKSTGVKSGALAENMCSIIASTVALSRTSEGEMNFDQHRKAIDDQWLRFYRLLQELDKHRGEALSLAMDPQGTLPWVVLADGIAAVRECRGLEKRWHNQEMTPSGTEYVAALVTAAAALRDSFSDKMLHNFETLLLGELFEEPSLTDPARMRAFYDKCDFANQIGDEDYEQLQNNLGGGFKDVTPEVYRALLDLMSASLDDTRLKLLPNAEFGNKLILKGVQETVELQRNVCLDQLALLILIEAEVNHGDEGIEFETAAVFGELIEKLKRLELINWLANTQISLPLSRERSGSVVESTGSLAKKAPPRTETITGLEGMLRHLLGFDPQNHTSMPQALTEMLVQICAPDSEYEIPPSATQCFLLKNGRPDLAMEFSRFAELNPFDIYVQGRVYLASNDAFAASIQFKKAAYGIGKFFVV